MKNRNLLLASVIAFFPSTIEILYAFNDDGRRILDNNFRSHRANNKRMGSSVSEIYFGSMIQELAPWLLRIRFDKPKKVYLHVITARVYIFRGGVDERTILHIDPSLTSDVFLRRVEILDSKAKLVPTNGFIVATLYTVNVKARRWIHFAGNLLNKRNISCWLRRVDENRNFFISCQTPRLP